MQLQHIASVKSSICLSNNTLHDCHCSLSSKVCIFIRNQFIFCFFTFFIMNIVITGASKGIGKATALQFAQKGNHLMLCARSESGLTAIKNELLSICPDVQVSVFAADLTLKDQVIAFGQFCLQFGMPDILVNNAGSYAPGNCYDEADGTLEFMLSLNLMSAYHLTRTLLPSMIQHKAGHIFNICSIAALRAYPGGGGYSISKFAMHGFSINLREELKQHGIKVTTIHPGAVHTDTWGNYDNSAKRIMEADDIAKSIFACTQLSDQAVVEEIIIRPQLGDL
jgi:NADP-dependent 3-hydroxy acid dehydrogenase YdfG